MNKNSDLYLKINATICVATSAILYGAWPLLATRLTSANFSISTMLFWRFFIAVVWMFCYRLIFFNNKKGKKKISYSTIILMFLLGAVCYSGSSGIYFVATKFIGTGIAMVIFFSYPLLIAILLWIKSREIINRFLFLALITMSIGLFMLSGNYTHSINTIGIFYAIISAVFYAVYVFFSHGIRAGLDIAVSTLLICLGCATTFLVITLFNHEFTIPHTMHDWFYILALGVIVTAIPVQLLLKGMQYMNPLYVSVLSVLEPLVTIWLGIIMLREHLTIIQWAGCIIILASALFIQLQHIRR